MILPRKRNNHILIRNAISRSLEGAANEVALRKMLESIEANSESCDHFLILFRRGQYFSGLYKYEEGQDIVTKIDGSGPKIIKNEDIQLYYKFDPPKRQFTEIQTKNIGPTISAISLKDHVWPRKSLVVSNGTKQ